MIATAKMTGLEFDALPYEEGRHLELWCGDVVEVPRANAEHQDIVTNLCLGLRSYLRKQQTGAADPDVEFAMAADLRLAPDIAILLGEKWRTLDRRQNPLLMSPDIAVEVISPSERASESTRKVRIYFSEGVSEIWQVFPQSGEVQVHRNGETTMTLRGTDLLQSSLLPGWQIALAELFRPGSFPRLSLAEFCRR